MITSSRFEELEKKLVDLDYKFENQVSKTVNSLNKKFDRYSRIRENHLKKMEEDPFYETF